MADSRASFEQLYRANQARAQAERADEPAAPSGGSTIPLTEAAIPLALEPGAELGLTETAPLDSGPGGSFFERRPRDLGGLADPNQSDAANPYDSQALPRSGLRPPQLPARGAERGAGSRTTGARRPPGGSGR